MIFIPIIIVVIFAIVFAPAATRRKRYKSKGFFTTLLDGQKQTEKRNGSHRGVMCPPGGSRRRK